jgi:alpha-amylase
MRPAPGAHLFAVAALALLDGDPALRTPMSWTASTANGGFTTSAPFRALSANTDAGGAASIALPRQSFAAFPVATAP